MKSSNVAVQGHGNFQSPSNLFSLFTSFYPKPISDPLNDSPWFTNWCTLKGFPDRHHTLRVWIIGISIRHWTQVRYCQSFCTNIDEGMFTEILRLFSPGVCQARLNFMSTALSRLLSKETGKWPWPCTETIDDFIPKFFTVVECYSIVSVIFCGKTISYVIKRIDMIADALVAGTKLMQSHICDFSCAPPWCSKKFLTLFNTPQSCFHEKSIENCRNHAS